MGRRISAAFLDEMDKNSFNNTNGLGLEHKNHCLVSHRFNFRHHFPQTGRDIFRYLDTKLAGNYSPPKPIPQIAATKLSSAISTKHLEGKAPFQISRLRKNAHENVMKANEK